MTSESERKVTKMGVSSLGICLPKSWCSFNNVKYGDNLSIIEHEFLILVPENKKEFLSKFKELIRGVTNG